MLHIDDIINIVTSILKQNNINCKVKCNQCYGYAMGYNYKLNTITFNDVNIFDLNKKFPDIEESDFIKVITYHEIGHYLDRKDNQIKTRREREENAYKQGYKFVPSHLISYYDRLNLYNLKRY